MRLGYKAPENASNMLNRAFITKTTSGELGFRNRKSTRDDLLLTDVGVRVGIVVSDSYDVISLHRPFSSFL